MIERIRFETVVKDIKTSKVKDDICPLNGELRYDGCEVKFKIVASSDNKDVLEELFGDVGQTVTFEIVDNAQQLLGVRVS